MNLLKTFLFALPLLVFAALGLLFFDSLDEDPSLLPSARLNQPMPEFQLGTLKNPQQILSQTDLKGPLLLNVWATWCPSCKIEHPTLLQLAASGITLVGLNYKDQRPAALDYLQRYQNPFTYNLYDPKGMLGLDLGVYGAPETYFIDANGVIRHRHVGVLDGPTWEQELLPIWRSIANPANVQH